jgi:hypothetical protein
MAERDIVTIVWHELDDEVVLFYAEGEPDHLVGAQSVVAELARSVGLKISPAPPGTIRWERTSEASELHDKT